MRRSGQILMVDDSRTDACLFVEALKECSNPAVLDWVPSVSQAVTKLRKDLKTSVILPDLILLDINMPGLDGWDMLRQLKQDPTLHRIPVLILSSSVAVDDIQRAYALNANCYLVKPSDWDEYVSLVKTLCTFWLGTAQLATVHQQPTLAGAA